MSILLTFPLFGVSLRSSCVSPVSHLCRYENELSMRQSVEADIAGLKMLLGELGAASKDLSLQIDSLKDELESMKNNHLEVTVHANAVTLIMN